MMQKLFPAPQPPKGGVRQLKSPLGDLGACVPELRFPGFEGEWIEKRLGEISDKIASGKSKQNDLGKYPLYGSTGIIGKADKCSHEGKFILIARVGANAGLTNIVEGSFGVTDNTLVLDLKKSVSISFTLSLLHKYNLNKLIFGSGQPLITGGQLKMLKLSFPSLPEQKKIANFLTTIDKKTTQVDQQIKTMTQFKKGLLQQMFV
jgi:type I restriction enzyme, S subunit